MAEHLTDEQLDAYERDYSRPGQVHEDVRSLVAEVRILRAKGAREVGIGLLADAHRDRITAEKKAEHARAFVHKLQEALARLDAALCPSITLEAFEKLRKAVGPDFDWSTFDALR